MDRQTDGWMNRQMHGHRQTDGQTDGCKDRQTDRWMDRRTDRQMDGRIDRQMDKWTGPIS